MGGQAVDIHSLDSFAQCAQIFKSPVLASNMLPELQVGVFQQSHEYPMNSPEKKKTGWWFGCHFYFPIYWE